MKATLTCLCFAIFFQAHCLDLEPGSQSEEAKVVAKNFETAFEWTHINYTWPSKEAYEGAIKSGSYVPENNVMAGVKSWGDDLYIALPRARRGAPVTLAYFSGKSSKRNPLLTPYPSWEMNSISDCKGLHNVQSMEIDTKGVMWVLEGSRYNAITKCQPKLVLLDLKDKGKVLHTFEFTNDLCLNEGGFLNDIVVDESDGGYAYITDTSSIDPGIIVYSRLQNRAWKIRDKSMFPDPDAANFVVDGAPNLALVPVDGITLSPIPKKPNEERTLYYCALASLDLYSISDKVLKSEPFCNSGEFRRNSIKFVGKKQSQSDGLAMDNKGNLFYGLLSSYGIGQWNINTNFTTSSGIIYQNNKTVIWPDSFAFDDKGYLYVIANGIHKYFNPNYPLNVTEEVKFRILKTHTGTKSYLYA